MKMPHNKPGKVRLLRNGEHDLAVGGVFERGGGDHHMQTTDQQQMFRCCTPRSCRTPDVTIDSDHPASAVKVICNNDECTKAQWMHKECFEG